MKLALITPGFSSSEDDWCIPVLLNIVRRLAERHDVHVFTLRYPHRRDRYKIGNATVHALGGATVGGFRRLPLLLRAQQAIEQQAPFDVVHGFWADEAGYVATRFGLRHGTPSVVSLMGGELVDLPDIAYGGWRSIFGRKFTTYALKHCHTVTGGSSYIINQARPFVKKATLTEIVLGVDTSLFQPQARPQNRSPHILHVASLEPVKDQTTLIEAFAIVKKQLPNARLAIAGDGALRTMLEQQSAALGLTDAIHFHGSLAHNDLSQQYASADLFVMSSRHESQSLTLLEALATGCPAAGTAVGLFPQLLPKEHVAPTGNATALAKSVLFALQNSSQANLPSTCSLDNTIEKFERLYADVAS